MRIKIAHIALVLSILALAVSLFTAVQVSQNSDDALINALMAQNQQLQAQIDALGIPNPGTVTDTSDVTLTAVGWPDGEGADITLTMTGAADGEALLRVMMGSDIIAEVPCLWDGTALTATASVPARNGYTYSVVRGSESRTLASPDNPVYPELVYLSDALKAFCNLVIGDWHIRDNVLTLENCYATIHTPQLGASGTLTCDSANLLLKHGDTVLAESAVTPVPGEESGSYACVINGTALTLPDLAQGEQVDLWLEVTLSDGQVLSVNAATWYAMSSGFSMAAG